jgi:transposase
MSPGRLRAGHTDARTDRYWRAKGSPTRRPSIESSKRKRVTRQILWDEYLERNSGGYRNSYFCELYRL